MVNFFNESPSNLIYKIVPDKTKIYERNKKI